MSCVLRHISRLFREVPAAHRRSPDRRPPRHSSIDVSDNLRTCSRCPCSGSTINRTEYCTPIPVQLYDYTQYLKQVPPDTHTVPCTLHTMFKYCTGSLNPNFASLPAEAYGASGWAGLKSKTSQKPKKRSSWLYESCCVLRAPITQQCVFQKTTSDGIGQTV